MKTLCVVLVVSVCTSAAWASQPGQPLDCSDWVFLEQGLSCSTYMAMNSMPLDSGFLLKGSTKTADNAGRLYTVDSVGAPFCILGGVGLYRYDGQSSQLIAFVCSRSSALDGDVDYVVSRGAFCCPSGEANLLTFDAVGGRFLMPLADYCRPDGWAHCLNYPGAGGNHGGDFHWIVSISGFTPLFEILQTYTPTATDLGFRVPAHPEGLRTADHFDTYWGHVADLPDFTQAQPMACIYPTDHAPQVGEYLTVSDTSPLPSPGQATYVVTAVSNGAQRRYGRQRIGVTLSGRNPALLPFCPLAEAIIPVTH